MRIGVVTTSYPRWHGDPAGSFVEGMTRALWQRGHEIMVVHAAADDEDSRRERARRDLESELQRQRWEVEPARELPRDAPRPQVIVTRSIISYGIRSGGIFYRGGAPDLFEQHPGRLLDGVMFGARLAATVARYARHWDHVIAHWLPCALAALPARKPMTAIAHGGDVYLLHRLRLLAPALRALRGARRVYVGEHLRALANDAGGIVQPMGIDLARFAALGRAPATPPIVLVAGRLVPIKGVDTVIEAMTYLPHARLVIAGDGPERRALQARAHANTRRGAAAVAFLGEVDTARRDQLLREASVVVVASRTLANGRTEGCPTIALEALAAGVPVVATIGRANVRVPPNDPRTLASAIERVLAAPPVTQSLVADLDWPVVAPRLLGEK